MKALALVATQRRFWEKVNKDGPIVRSELGACALWTGAPNRQGYGVMSAVDDSGRAVTLLAHRVAFFLARGRWPEPFALHHCDTPACVRDDHLFEGTARDNTDDMMTKGRNRSGGHEYAGERNPNAKLTNVQRGALRAARAGGQSFAELGRTFGITRQAARYVANQGRRTP